MKENTVKNKRKLKNESENKKNKIQKIDLDKDIIEIDNDNIEIKKNNFLEDKFSVEGILAFLSNEYNSAKILFKEKEERKTKTWIYYEIPLELFNSIELLKRVLRECIFKTICEIKKPINNNNNNNKNFKEVIEIEKYIYNFDYDEEKKILKLPRYKGYEIFGVSDILEFYFNLRKKWDNKNIGEFTKKLDKERKQEEASIVITKKLDEYPYVALLSLDPGMGKTLSACKKLYDLKEKGIVALLREDWIEQWKIELESSIPGIKIGILKQDLIELDCDVLLCSVLTLISRSHLKNNINNNNEDNNNEFNINKISGYNGLQKKWKIKDIWSDLCDFSFLIIDEAHHFSSSSLRKIFSILPPYRILCLSGTPERSDKNEKILEQWIGPVSFRGYKVIDKPVIVKIRSIEHTSNKPIYKLGSNNKELNSRYMAIVIEKNVKRIEIIARQLSENFLLNNKKRYLVVAKTNEFLKSLEFLFTKFVSLKDKNLLYYNNEENSKLIITEKLCGVYYSGIKYENREYAKKNWKVIFSNFDMFSEAQNIPDLERLWVLSPKGKLNQLIHRIIRSVKLLESPEVVLYVENYKPFVNYLRGYHSYFQKSNKNKEALQKDLLQYKVIDETSEKLYEKIANKKTENYSPPLPLLNEKIFIKENNIEECPF